MVVQPVRPEADTIRIVVAVIRDPQGRTLLVRKQGATVFQQPGGKRAPADRDDLATLARELDEELGCKLLPESAQWLCQAAAAAANEQGCTVEAEVYLAQLAGVPVAQAEIAELRWIEPAAALGDPTIAELSRRHIMPRLICLAGDGFREPTGTP